MRTRSFIAVVIGLLLLFVGAGAVLAYDNDREGVIAEGVRVGGVDVGGLRSAPAKARLQRELLDPLRRPIVVSHASRRFTLSPAEARIAADLEGMVAEALSRSRSGGLLVRTFRNATGGRVDADLEPRVSFSRKATLRLVDRVRRTIDRPAKDASLKYLASGIEQVASKDGLALQAGRLHRELNAAVVSPTADRTLTARTKRVEPKVTTENLAASKETVLIVDRRNFRLRLFKRLKLDRTYPIAVGKAGLETPAGLYSVANKAINPAWHVPDSDWAGKLRGKVIPGGTPDNPIKARWLGIYDGVGIHGTSDRSSIGSNASHGCVRMLVEDVTELYDRVPVSAPVFIA